MEQATSYPQPIGGSPLVPLNCGGGIRRRCVGVRVWHKGTWNDMDESGTDGGDRLVSNYD